MARRSWWIAVAGGVLLAGAALCLGLVNGAIYSPPDVQSRQVHGEGEAPALPRGDVVRVLVWNVQFGAGRSVEFFYDGGEGVSVPPSEVQSTLMAMEGVVEELEPDIILWQELDRDSRRTGRVDQVKRMTEGWPQWADAPYHKALYVPVPSHEHLGKVDMRLVSASRFAMASAIRHQLPLLQESALRQALNLKRALLEVRLPVEGGGEVALLNTHLSAFSKGDGTLGKQMAALDARVATLEEAGIPWLLAGDFNSLPPGDDPSRLPDAELYAEDTTPIQPLLDKWTPTVSPEELMAQPERWRTYVPFGATAPDRTLDYAFTGGGLEVVGMRVVHGLGHISDHLPLVVDIRVP